MTLSQTIRPLRLTETWENVRAPLQTWVQQIADALVALAVQPSLELRVVRFTLGGTPASMPVPPGRITGPPSGLFAVKLVDAAVPPSSAAGRFQVPALTWRFDGTTTVLDALDPVTVAQLTTGHVYDLTVLVLGA